MKTKRILAIDCGGYEPYTEYWSIPDGFSLSMLADAIKKRFITCPPHRESLVGSEVIGAVIKELGATVFVPDILISGTDQLCSTDKKALRQFIERMRNQGKL